jgi:structural maintenance of chromosome 2
MAPVKNQTHFRYNPPQGFNGQNVLGKVMTLFKIKDLTRFGLAVEAVAGG